MVRVTYQSTGKPSSASRIAGAITSARSMVPKRSRARARPATEPGMATDFGPKLLASPTTWRHGKSACATPSPSSKQPS